MANIINAITTGAGGLSTTADASGSIQIATNNGTTAMTIDTSQNVGIGTASPADSAAFGKALDIAGSAGNGASVYVRANASATNYLALGQDIGGTSYIINRANSPTLFYTNNTERMRIDSSGSLLVGKTSTALGSVGFQADGPNGITRISNSSTVNANTVWEVYSTGASTYRFYVGMAGTVFATNTTISSLSDVRFKENIVDLDVGLDAVLALKPRKFDWKEGKGKDIKGDRGFIAQEFETVFPNLIDEWKEPAPEGEEPYKSVRQDLIPVLVKAIQEQQTIINDLKARITALEGAK